MSFKLRKLEYAFTEGGIMIHIFSANKVDAYFLNEECSISLIFCDGEKNVRYWRKKGNVTDEQIRDYFGSSESLEHYNRKMEIVHKKEFKHDGYTYIGYTAKAEYSLVINGKRKFIDAVLIDKDNNPMIGIEVYKTNKKSQEDIKLFNQLNFPIYEESTDTGESYVISAGEYQAEEIERLEASIMAITTEILQDQKRIDNSSKPIQEAKKLQRLVNEEYFRDSKEITELERIMLSSIDNSTEFKARIKHLREVKSFKDSLI